MPEFSVKPLDEHTWPDFARLAEIQDNFATDIIVKQSTELGIVECQHINDATTGRRVLGD